MLGKVPASLNILLHTYRDQIFKTRVRSHLDCCDTIYHIPVKTRETVDFDYTRSLHYLMNLLESTQYQAALAVSGAWKGTSREKIYNELGWESLELRRIFRRLTQFYKIMSGLTPEYLRTPIPSLHGHLFGYRFTNVLENIKYRTDRYKIASFQTVSHCGMNWVLTLEESNPYPFLKKDF